MRYRLKNQHLQRTLDKLTANVLYDRIVDAFKAYGIDLESDDDDE